MPNTDRPRRLMEIDPDLPGFVDTWNGERGPAWQRFVRLATYLLSGLWLVWGFVIVVH